jgi:hypothetical protein
MHRTIIAGFGVWLVCVALGLAAADGIRLKAGLLEAGLSSEDGRLVSLSHTGRPLLVGAGTLWLTIDNQTPVRFGPEFRGFAVGRKGSLVAAEGQHPTLPVRMAVEWIGGADLECRVRLTGEVQPRATARVELRLPLRRQTLNILAPSGDDRKTTDFSHPLAFSFRGRGQNLVMPAVVIYSPDEWGLTALADFAQPTRGFEVSLGDKAAVLAIRRVDLRLEPGRPVDVSMIVAGHAGDWRPGLGHVVQRFPQFFVVQDDRLPKLHGPFVCSGGAPSDATIDQWKAQHVQTVEVHGTIPFYGQHLPLGDRWTIFADDCWHRLREQADPHKPADDAPWREILAYVNRKVPPNITVDMVRDYIRRLHARGIYALMYFNPTEAWRPWVTAHYPEALVHTGAGKPIPVWYESYMVCPDPDSRWGKHLVDEFTKMMDLYAEADGFFMDQSCYDNIDYAHDDGWSISQGRTGYRMGWAINQISQRCRALAKPRGKFMWWNGPYNSDIARYAEGMMAEAGNEDQVRMIHYLTIGGRACCTLSRTGEEVFQNCAAYGLYPTAMGTSALGRLAARYAPVIDLFAGKQWIFHPRALELPEGTKGNIYRLPDGNVLAVIVTGGRSVDGPEFDLDVPLAMRLPNAEEFRAAYLLSPDLLGKRRLKIVPVRGGIRVVVPRHRSVSAVLLARAGVHLALDEPRDMLAGRPGQVEAVLENFETRPLEGQWVEPERRMFTLRPGGSVRRAVQVPVAKGDALRTAIDCAAEVEGRRLGGTFELYVDRPLSLDLLVPPESVPEGEQTTVRLAVFNAGGASTVRLRLTADSQSEQVVPFISRTRQVVAFPIHPTRPGRLSLVAQAQAGAERVEARAQVDVHATRASAEDLRRARSGVLAFELAGSDGGKYKHKPVFVNGVRLDVLPQQGDRWARFELPLPPAALARLAARNEVRIENTVGDAFKMRNFQLRLRRDDGLLIVSEVDRQAYTSCGWDLAEGKVFKLHEPLAGITVAIPSR